jgi:hypothetical protein
MRRLLSVFAMLMLLAGAVPAAQQVTVSAWFADVPGGAEVPATVAKLEKVKGITLLSSPKITVLENIAGTIDIEQNTAVPGGGQVPLGVSLTVKTSVTEKGNIWFSGNLRDRSRGGGEKTERLETVGFVTREWYFSGYTPNAGTVVVRTVPATARVSQDGKVTTTTRELVVYLQFEKLVAKSQPPASKPTSSKKSTSTSTKKPATTKSGLRRR